MPKKTGNLKSATDDIDALLGDGGSSSGVDEVSNTRSYDDATRAFVDDAMLGIKAELDKNYAVQECCNILGGEATDVRSFTKPLGTYLNFITEQVNTKILTVDIKFDKIKEEVTPILISNNARLGLKNMIVTVGLTLEALCYCSVDLFSTPVQKRIKGCWLTKCLQKLKSR